MKQSDAGRLPIIESCIRAVSGVYGQATKGRELLGPTIRTADGKVMVLDPRGLVIRGDLVVYSPRDIISSPAETPILLSDEMREWMRPIRSGRRSSGSKRGRESCERVRPSRASSQDGNGDVRPARSIIEG